MGSLHTRTRQGKPEVCNVTNEVNRNIQNILHKTKLT